MSLVYAGLTTWGPFAVPHFVNVIKGNKKKATPEVEIIGLKDPDLFHKTASGTALTETTFDTVTRPDEARILFTNASGASQIITACWIRGKLVKKVGGDSGYTHDSHVDYEAIARDGENKFELGNDWIVTLTQVNKLADYHWKYNKTKKHIYTVSLAGVQSWFEPGEWYQLTIGAAGTAEYIDSVVECYSVRTSYNATGSFGTQVSFREVEESWKFDSNAVARYVAAGGHSRVPQGTAITVGSSTYAGYADFYCDGTADQTEINAAITAASAAEHGVVRLIGGQFNITAAIEGASDVTLWLEAGVSVVKNCNDYAIECVGTSGTHKSRFNIGGNGTITRDAGDTNSVELVHLEYLDDFDISGVTIDDSYEDGLYIINCTNGKVEASVKILDCAGVGLKIVTSTVIVATAISISGCGIGYECVPSLVTDLIDRGDCESSTTPAMTGEVAITAGDATWARSSDYAFGGSYSFKYTDNAAAGLEAYLYIADNTATTDLHGVTPGKTYRFECMIYIPSGLGTSTELRVSSQSYYGGAWNSVPAFGLGPRPIYDEWQKLSLISTLSTAATGFRMKIASGFSSGEYCYLDNIRLYEFDEVDAGCQLVNSSITDCTDVGVMVENSYTLIQNNQVTGNANTGIAVLAGYQSKLDGNRCYNNGADTGLSNTNSANFFDGGIDTQIG